MSSPIPIPKRPITYTGGPLRKETKTIPGDMNKHLERPVSEVSLPLPESFAEMDGFSSQNSFRIGVFAALSPRPTVRYDHNPRSALGKERAHPKPSVHDIIQEEDPSSKRRIDDLADDLDSGGLRELLEKDRRRREKKKENDGTKLQRQLERRAQRQKENEARRGGQEASRVTVKSSGKTPANNLHRHSDEDNVPAALVNGGSNTIRETTSEAVRTSPHSTPEAPDPFADPNIQTRVRGTQASPIRNPFADEQDDEPEEKSILSTDKNEPVVPERSVLRNVGRSEPQIQPAAVQAVHSPPTSPVQEPHDQPPVDRSSVSQASTIARMTTPDIPGESGACRRASDQSSQHLSSWTSFFRRGGKPKRDSTDRGRVTPEFSNTSRESFARRNPPPIVPPRSFRRTESGGTPQRTMSKFREDLPELPLSPPDSRVHSPEAVVSPSSVIATSASRQLSQSQSGTMDNKSLATSPSIPTPDRSKQGPPSSRNLSWEPDAVDPELQPAQVSQSLASVDSEGSWLSGKPVKRISAQSGHPLRQSQSSITAAPTGSLDTGEEHEVTNDEYFNRLSPPLEDRRDSSISALRKPSSTAIDLRGERGSSPAPELLQSADQMNETWHGSVGRQPEIVRHSSRAKSREGLLNEYRADEATTYGGSSAEEDDDVSIHDFETPAEEYRESPILRAKSVEYKGHARHISAGSARLLDIRRASTVSERSTADKRASATNLQSSLRHEEALKSLEGQT